MPPLPVVEQSPNRYFGQMNQDQPPRHPDQQPRDRPKSCWWLEVRVHESAEQHGETKGMHDDSDGHEESSAEVHREHGWLMPMTSCGPESLVAF